MKNKLYTLITLILLAQTSLVFADGEVKLQMPSYYSDNMMLQYGVDITVNGKGKANETVHVSIEGHNLSAQVNYNNQWDVVIPPLKAGGPYTLTVSSSTDTLRYNNILAGDVWFCSGQSNMEFMLKETPISKDELARINNSNIRLYDMKAKYRTNAVMWDKTPLDSINAYHYFQSPSWETLSQESVADFSAVAYYFGKMLNDSLDIPIGLICNAVGGSPTEAWIDAEVLQTEFPEILHDWKNNGIVQDWVRGRALLNIKKSRAHSQLHPYMPGYLFESGVRPFDGFPMKGVIWYQGESNAHDIAAHEKLFKLLVYNWRHHWQSDSLPFYYVQLSSLNRDTWPEFRDSQRRMLKEIPKVGMAVSSDYGDPRDVHPVNKKPIGQRLARLALADTYNKSIVSSGPLFQKVDFLNQTAKVYFEQANGLKTSDGAKIRGFEIAGRDGVYHTADAFVYNSCVYLSSQNVDSPKYVRYAWQPYTTANLVNGDELPASTFCSTSKK